MTNPSPIKHIAKFLPTIEVVSLVSLAMGFALKAMHHPAGNTLTNLALSTLAVVYFLTAQLPLEIPSETNSEQPKLNFIALLAQRIAPKIMGIGSSVSIVGIQFAIFNWAGFRQMLVIGSSSLAMALVVALAASSSEEVRKALQPRLLRAVPLMLIGFYLLWVYGIEDPALFAQ